MLTRIIGIIAPYPDFDDELREACFEGDVTRALKALENGGNAESRGETGNSPFHVAAYRNHENVVKALLRQGVNVLHTGRSGNTALHYASRRGNLGVVKVLLDRDDSKQLINMKNEKGFTALHLATLSLRKEVVFELEFRFRLK